METVDKLIQRVRKTEHGFSDIRKASNEIVESQHSVQENLSLSKKLLASDVYQARMLAVFLLGHISSQSAESLNLLKRQVSKDDDWRVQEILAQAFELYCSSIGYEKALPTIKNWLSDKSPNVRRAVTEGLRIWTSRPYFREHPETAIQLLSNLKDDESEYVRKSVGNALRDISRKHKELIREELNQWILSNKNIQQVHKLASRFL
jgi:HEAT repeat protein